MSVRDGDLPGDDRIRARATSDGARIMAGSIGVALVFGAVVFLATDEITDGDRSTVHREPGALAPLVTSAGASSASSAPASERALVRPGEQGRKDDAGALSAAGGEVPTSGPAAASTSVRATAEGRIRVTTARGDLTGRSDLMLAADGGDGRCTQNLRVSGAGARVVPAMLLCWRTSPARSVITLATAAKGRPSTAISLAVLDREWARLG